MNTPPPLPQTSSTDANASKARIILKITRKQEDLKGFLGGHKGVNFSITATAHVTAEMRQLIEHYKLGSQIVAEWEPDDEKQKLYGDGSLSVSTLLNGWTVNSESLAKLQQVEEQVVEGCKQLRLYLQLAQSFGSESTIEID